MRRILFTASDNNTVGGIAIWGRNILSYYEKHREDVEIDLFPLNRKDFTTFANSKMKRIVSGVIAYANVIGLLKSKLKSKHYDILHINTSALFGLLRDYLMVLTAHKYGVKVVIHWHFGRIPTLMCQSGWESKFIKKVIRMSDYNIVLDQMSLDALLMAGFTNVVKVPNPLSEKVVSLVEMNSISQKNRKQILYVGQCYRQKGIYELVEACAGIDNIKLVLCGSISPETRADLEKITNGGDWLDIRGKISYEKVIAEMLGCGVFTLPSYSEGFPNVILESMACGCPIVSTTVGAIPEILAIDTNEPCGICIESQNVKSLRNALSFMLCNPEQANRYGALAKERVMNQYSMVKVWRKLVEVWEKV